MTSLDYAKWIKYARELAATYSNCSKMKYGSVIVKEGKRLVEGWNHSYNNEICNPCLRIGVKSGTRHEMCRAVHAEQMALLEALNNQVDISGAILYVAGLLPDGTQYKKPADNPRFYCTTCSRLLSQTKLKGVVVSTTEGPLFKTLKQICDDAYAWVREAAAEEPPPPPPPLPQIEKDNPPSPPAPPPPQMIKEGEVPKS